ncbi:MAG: M6 family metalloprotease domain-containing protein [Bacteroidales bacterium]|nr:M6 family metalloprotease domain-containing protein [Candidatus Physcousia equi]
MKHHRILLLTAYCLFLLCAARLHAVPAYPVRKTITLTDGTTLVATLSGDERLSYYRCDDGRLAFRCADGSYELRDASYLHTATRERVSTDNQRRSARVRKRSQKRVSYVGEKHGLVILAQFSNQKFSMNAPSAYFKKFFNLEGYNENGMSGSVHDYFKAQSYGQFNLEFDVVGPVTLNHPYGYYGAAQGDNHDSNVKEFVVDAVNAAADMVDFSRYDWDGDGEVDQIFIIYAGYGEAQGGESDCIWPHEWSISEFNVVKNGVRIGTYGCASELKGGSGTTVDGIGTACHEFSHCLGLADHYDTANSNYGMGNWDIMCSGNYNNGSCTPAAYTSYERWVSGWLTPIEIDQATFIEGMKPLTDAPEAYILYNDVTDNEFYLLENRQQKGFDAALGGHGLLVLHVDYDPTSWHYNQVNTDANHQRMTIIPADNLLSRDSESGDPFPGTSRKSELSDNSKPAATVYHADRDGNKLMGKPIADITEKNGTISFAALRGAISIPRLHEAEQVTSSGFTISWDAVEDATGYEINLRERPAPPATPEEAVLLTEDFSGCYSKSTGISDIGTRLDKYLTTKGFNGSKLYTSPQWLKMGSKSATGTLTTPLIDDPLSTDLTIVAHLAPFDQEGQVQFLIHLGGRQLQTGIMSVSEAQDFVIIANRITEPCTITLSAPVPVSINRLTIYDGAFDEEQLGLEEARAERHFCAPTFESAATSETTQAPPSSSPSAAPMRRSRDVETTYKTDATSYTFTQLNPASNYFVSLRAITALGQSKWSHEQTVTLNATDIRSLQAATPQAVHSLSHQTFDLSGRLVQGVSAGAAPKLRPGIYVRGGKKVVVK